MRWCVPVTTKFSVLDGDHGEKPEPKELFVAVVVVTVQTFCCLLSSIVVVVAAVAVAADVRRCSSTNSECRTSFSKPSS